MFLKNFDNIMLSTAFGQQRGSYTGNSYTDAEYQDDSTTISRATNGSYYGTISLDSSYYGLWIAGHIKLETLPSGQSSAPAATYTDWWPQNIINSGISLSLANRTITTENGVDYITYSVNITNTSSSNIVIAGLWLQPYCRVTNISGSTSQTYVALYHEVFDSPVTLVPSGVCVHSIKMPITNFRPNKPSA